MAGMARFDMRAALRRPLWGLAGSLAALAAFGPPLMGVGFGLGVLLDGWLAARRRPEAAAEADKANMVGRALGRGWAWQAFLAAQWAHGLYVAVLVLGAWRRDRLVLDWLATAPDTALLPFAPAPRFARSLATYSGLGETGVALVGHVFIAGNVLLLALPAILLWCVIARPRQAIRAVVEARPSGLETTWPLGFAAFVGLIWFVFCSNFQSLSFRDGLGDVALAAVSLHFAALLLAGIVLILGARAAAKLLGVAK
jgi:hypothetical protein